MMVMVMKREEHDNGDDKYDEEEHDDVDDG